MKWEELDRALSTEEEIVPSAGFTDAVMEAVHREATTPPPILFPWKCVLPGLALAVFAALAVLLLASPTKTATSPVFSPTHLAAILGVLPETTRRLGLDWLIVALLLAWASVKLSMRLASWKS
jgi:anti-sigma factor RsiW